jgi:putative solute:sodium symporter small subunit
MQLTEKHRQYWNANLRLCGILLAVWFVVTFVMAWFARDLSFIFFGWPMSFFMAAFGSPLIYVGLIWFYAKRMDELDIEFDVEE